MPDKNIEALGTLLQYGPIGLGLAIAVVAGIVLLSGKPETARTKAANAIMIFGFAVFALGISLEFYKSYTENSRYQQALDYYSRMPDQLWQDYLTAKVSEVFKVKSIQKDESTLKIGGKKSYTLSLKSNQCIGYFAATPPPSAVQVDVKGEIQETTRTTNDYFKSGEICSTTPADSSASVTVELDGLEGQRSPVKFETFPITSLKQQPTQISKVVGVVCTGELEPLCNGRHDLFVPCGASVDSAIKARFCTQYTLRGLSSVSGNRCGYGLIEVSCLTD